MKNVATIPRQISSSIEVFANKFPTCDDVLRVFSPSNWGMFIREQERCLTAPNVTLAMLSEYYDKSTSTELVVNQYKGLHDLTSATVFNEKGVRMAADLFLCSYEHELTPYSLMLYFGRYSLYKQSYRDFDLQDILQQCRKKFIPWWSQMRAQLADQQAPEEQQTKGIPLQEMVLRWVREGRTDESFHEGGLYQIGSITDAMIGQARDEYAAELASGCF